MISRRHLLAAAAALPAATVVGARTAGAKPIVLADLRVRRYGPVMVIGDSQAGGYVRGLQEKLVDKGVGPFRCDIQGSRSISRDSSKFPSGVAAVRAARAAGFDPQAWVVALGMNDMWFIGQDPSLAHRMIDAILTEIGPTRDVVFPTVWQRKKGAHTKFNSALWTATTRWPRLRVVDWGSIAAAHPDWHGSDGAHYTTKGANGRNAFLASLAVQAVEATRANQIVRRHPRGVTLT